eukprot:TRINITY_DN3490_c1_g1_i1.p1 TRINITY_DN3490_c1_g1~~TRINITY_DN3490_c1_g1_i1.p1  ORF type:complete len:718 (-),score=125.81 TRINITY_DN3490_c1_g1_i1:56-2209(-)
MATRTKPIKIGGVAILIMLLLGTSSGYPLPTNNRDFSIYSEPISVVDPPFPKVEHGKIIPNEQIWGQFEPPYQTSAYWTNAYFGDFDGLYGLNGSLPFNTFPYLIRTIYDGAAICYPIQEKHNMSVTSRYHKDITLRAKDTSNRKLVYMDQVGITMEYYSDDGFARLILSRGSPYVTMFLSNTTAFFDTMFYNSVILSINGVIQNTAKLHGSFFRVVMSNGQTWLIWSLNGDVTLSIHEDRQHIYMHESVYFGFIRVALMFRDEDEQPLKDHVNTIVYGANIKADLLGGSGSYSINWLAMNQHGKQLKNADPLVLGLPHHADLLTGYKEKIMIDTYPTIKGKMTGYIGSSWVLTYKQTSIEWDAPRDIDPDKLQLIMKTLEKDKDLNKEFHQPDCYGFGKFISALGRLAIISDGLGSDNISTYIRNRMKTHIERWFIGSDLNSTSLVYDTSWGGLISKDGWEDNNRDYGNAKYNDHHYHYGYYIYAVAAILKGDPNYEHKDTVLNLIRDIANPSSKDPFFPVTRHKDWYLGHSWAQGADSAANGKNQESTSEAVNAYYGITLYGLVTGNQIIENLGRLLLAMEIHSTHTYWQITPPSPIYPDVFANNGVVGVLWSDKVDYATFFGGQVQFIHCIQMLPYVPVSEELLRKSWMTYDWKVLKKALDDPSLTEEWRAYVLEAMAIIDKEKAWKLVQTIGEDAFDKGNSRTNTYWWVATRP